MQTQRIILVWLLCCAALANCQRRAIHNLPRLNFKPNFNQYSGYLTSTNKKRLFYWLVESSQVSPSEAPLVLWLNGGPGCSSIGGLLMTNGPFLANDRAELDRNDLAWNRLANMLYIDSPNGVGLSEFGSVNQSVLNDQDTTELNLGALVHFFSLFPEYRTRPFYMAGESYAGIYIPLLAHAIQLSHYYPEVINLKGIAVGNGLHMSETDMILNYSRKSFKDVMGINLTDLDISQNKHEGINPYNIAKPCHYPILKDAYHCLNSTGLVNYLNDKNVRAALGVRRSVSRAYSICANLDKFMYYGTTRHVLPELVALAEENIFVMLYSGNLDSLIPTKATQILLQKLPQESNSADKPWFYCLTKQDNSSSSLQSGGLEKSYMDGMIRYRTVVGAGHSVATDRPDMAFQILEDFLYNGQREKLECA